MSSSLSGHFTYKRLFRFVLPSIGMMVFTSIYGVVDGFFVSNYAGSTQFAAINLVIPFLMMLAAIGFMIGTGGTALVSFYLGAGDAKKANNTFSLLTYTVMAVGLLFTIVGELLLKDVVLLLGATENMLPYCILYGRIGLLSQMAFMLQNMFQSFMVAAGKPRLGFVVTVLSGVTNMVFDFILVGLLSFGVAGAAAATALSECVGGFIPFIYFAIPNSSLLKLGKIKFDMGAILRSCGNGASEFVTSISVSAVSMLYNVQLIRFAGENGVSAYGVIMYVGFIFIAVFIGYSMGAAPLVGFNYGAGNHEELKNLYGKSLKIITIFEVIMFLSSEALAPALAKLFVGYDNELMEMTRNAFRIYSASYLISGINIYASSFFTALGNGVISAVISFSRTLVFQVVIVLTLPLLFGINGIWWATFVAELLSVFISGFFFLKMRRVYHY